MLADVNVMGASFGSASDQCSLNHKRVTLELHDDPRFEFQRYARQQNFDILSRNEGAIRLATKRRQSVSAPPTDLAWA